MAIALYAVIGGLVSSSAANTLLVSSHERRHMLNPKKTLEREALLRRIRELDAEVAQHQRDMREGEARLLIEEQLRLSLQRLIETNFRTWQVRSSDYASSVK